MCPTRNFTPLTRMESYFYRFRGGRGVPGGRDRGTCRPANYGTIAQETFRLHRFLVWSDCGHIATPDPLLHIDHSFSEIQSNTDPPGGHRERSPEVCDLFLGLPFLWSILRGSSAVEPRRTLNHSSPPQIYNSWPFATAFRQQIAASIEPESQPHAPAARTRQDARHPPAGDTRNRQAQREMPPSQQAKPRHLHRPQSPAPAQ